MDLPLRMCRRQVGSVTSFWGLRNGGELSGRGFLEKLLLKLLSQKMGTRRERPEGSPTEETKAQSRNLVAGVTACQVSPEFQMRWDTMGRAAENIRVSQPLTVKELESNIVGNAKPEKIFE